MIESYNTLPFGLYMQINGILQAEGDDLTKQVRIIALLDGRTEAEVLALPLADYRALAAKAAFLSKDCTPGRVADTFTLAGVTYIPTRDFMKISTAQYIDFQTFSARGIEAWPELLSVFLVPEGKTYNEGYDIALVQQACRDVLTLQEAVSLTAFFLTSFRQSIEDSLTSLTQPRKGKPLTERAKALLAEAETMLRTLGDGLQM